EKIGDGVASLCAWKPCFENSRDMRGGPRDVERPAADENQRDGLAGGGDGFEELLLLSGQRERCARSILAAHVVIFAEHEDNLIGTVCGDDSRVDLRVRLRWRRKRVAVEGRLE